MMKIQASDLTISPEKITSWISQYDIFLANFTGDSDGQNVMINSQGLTVNSFHTETGRGGYFSTTSGTSEGQTLTLRGSLLAYKATQDKSWLTRSLLLADAMLTVLYQGRSIPNEPDVTWVPHWLFNTKKDFKAQEYFTNYKAPFKNGKATLKINDLFKVFSVRATNATLVWDSPFSVINGKSYQIATIEYVDDNTATVTLSDNTVTADLLVVYGTNTGPIIKKGENYDAYPIWRKLQEGETVCAIDSLAWVLDCFKLLYDATSDEKWARALNSTSEALRHAFHIDNSIVYITPPRLGYDIFENGIYRYSTRENIEIYTQNKKTGFIDIHYPAITKFGDGQIGKGSVNANFGNDDYIHAKIGSDQKIVMNLSIDEENVYDPDKRWVVPIHLDGSGKVQTFDLKKEDFFKSASIFWGPNYRGHAEGTMIHDEKSSVTSETIVDGNTAIQHVEMAKVTGGWAQFLFGLGQTPTFPFDLRYKTNNDIDFVVRDVNDKPWRFRLPKSNQYNLITLEQNLFTSDDGLNTFPTGQFSSLLVDSATSSSEIDIDYIGTLVTLPDNTNYSTITLSYSGLDEVNVSIELIAPMPTIPLAYVPYVAPFDYHLLEGNVNTWRGPAYSGYQTPYIWQEIPDFNDESGNSNEDALNTNVRFMSDAQAAYRASTGIIGGFAPVYFWNRWDSIQYEHEPDTWGWLPAPDPNVNWGGFQYRAIDSVARVVRNNPDSLQAISIAVNFFKFIDNYWTTDFNMPTVFNEDEAPKNTYNDTHMASLLMRALINVYVSVSSKSEYVNETSVILKLINKTLNYLDYFHIEISDVPFSQSKLEGTFSTEPSKGQWYGFWGAEIISALSELLLNIRSEQTITTRYVYFESRINGNSRALTLVNNSQYFNTQKGSPCVITISGLNKSNPEWDIIQNGKIISSARFNLSLASNQRLVVSSLPEDQYARVYNEDGTYSDVSQLQDFNKANFTKIPEGNVTVIAHIEHTAKFSMEFKEERLLV
ncbi:hypothetical protein [Leuconostoc gasicomitatum]|uniref:hypothetical protein n=1 Tax=Leuconostoc gasicomitatum TaxID=115778 RepID=UPI001CC815EA|nr:hypothetical protein [Leuconostoc gasicomitatum]